MAGRTRGLTLGKYAPLHRGHQHVIRTGLAETDELLVVIYDASEVTHVPLPVRAGWIRALHPGVRVIEAWDGPKEVGYSPEAMRSQERYLIDELGLSGITHLYSSERYGAHVSAALGAIDRRVDEPRVHVPVSATDVRRDPFAHRRFVDPLVYRDLIANIVVLGAPSTGKTTLTERLAREYDTCWMPEYGREYWEQHQVERRLTPGQLVEIAERHLAREDALLGEANRFLFTDTNAITTASFARQYHGAVEPRLAALAKDAAQRYDLVLVCDTDIPYDDTWDRRGEVDRAACQRQLLGELHHRKIPYVLLQGSLEKRVLAVRRLLARFTKFTNVLDLFAPHSHE